VAREAPPRTLGRAILPALLAVCSLVSVCSAPAAAGPARVWVTAFRGPADVARAAEEEMARAFGALAGVHVIRGNLLALHDTTLALDPPEPALRMLGVRSALARAGIPLVVAGRIAKDGARHKLTLLLYATTTGKVVAAARVERPDAGLGSVANRMAARLSGLAFAAVGIRARPRASEPLPTPAPPPPRGGDPVTLEEEVRTGAESAADAPPPEPAPHPKPAPKPPPSPQTAEASHAVSDLDAWLGFGIGRVAPGRFSARGLVVSGEVGGYPTASGVGATRDFGLRFAFDTRAWFQGDPIGFADVRVGATHRFRLGSGKGLELGLGYELRRASAASAVCSPVTPGCPAAPEANAHMLPVWVRILSRIGSQSLLEAMFRAAPVVSGAEPVLVGGTVRLGFGIARPWLVGVYLRLDYLVPRTRGDERIDDAFVAGGAFVAASW
jgi:hypothetical protein